MNNSSAASSSANPIRQGEKRKRDSEPQPSSQNVNKGSATRARIVEILASTANGCLSELGYYPGMPTKLKELEDQNATWKNENVKLFEDNHRLMNMVRQLSTTMNLANIPELDKLKKITDLENEVDKLKGENVELRKFVPPDGQGLQMQPAKLLEDYRKLTESYRIAYDEVHRLRALNEQLQAVAGQIQQRGPVQALYPPQRAQSQSISHTQRLAMVVPQVQQHPPIRAVQGGQPITPPASMSPHQSFVPNVSHQGQRNDLVQTQNAVLQNRQRPSSNPRSRQTSLNIVSPSMQIPSQGNNPPQFGNAGPQSQAAQGQQQPLFTPMREDSFIAFANGVQQSLRRASNSSTPNHNSPNGNRYPVPQMAQPVQNALASNPSAANPHIPNGNPYPVFPTAHPIPISTRMHSNPVPIPQSRRGSDPLPTATATPNEPPVAEVPPPPLSASSILAQSSSFAPPGPPTQSQPVSTASSTYPGQPGQPEAMTISPQDTYINPPQTGQAQPISAGAALPPPSLVPLHHPDASVQIGEPNAPALYPPVQPPFLKPEQPSLSGESSISAEPVFQQSMLALASPAEPAPAPESLAPEDGNEMQVDTTEEGEESGEEVELGPDGLRLVKDCLDELFGESRVGQVVCRLCEARFAQKAVAEPPVPFVDPTDEQLEAHGIEEHQYVWDELRSPD